MKRIIRKLKKPDGSIEIWVPALNRFGQFIIADRSVDEQHNKAANQVYLDPENVEGLVQRVRDGWSVRMTPEDRINSEYSLISSGSIEII